MERKSIRGNPGFDFHSESIENRIIFGEAKYVCGKKLIIILYRKSMNLLS